MRPPPRDVLRTKGGVAAENLGVGGMSLAIGLGMCFPLVELACRRRSSIRKGVLDDRDQHVVGRECDGPARRSGTRLPAGAWRSYSA